MVSFINVVDLFWRGWPGLKMCSVPSLSQPFFCGDKQSSSSKSISFYNTLKLLLKCFKKIKFWFVHDRFVPIYCVICLSEFDLALAHLHIQRKTKFPQKIRDGTIRLFSETAVYLTSTRRQILIFFLAFDLCLFKECSDQEEVTRRKTFLLGTGYRKWCGRQESCHGYILQTVLKILYAISTFQQSTQMCQA